MLELELSIGKIFGSISGVITSLGVILGMYGANLQTHPIIISLISIGLSDSVSDALGIYYGVNVKSETSIAKRQAFFTFVSKLILPLMMIIPFIIVNKDLAVVINIIFGSSVILIISSKMFDNKSEVISNLLICWAAIMVTFSVGKIIK